MTPEACSRPASGAAWSAWWASTTACTPAGGVSFENVASSAHLDEGGTDTPLVSVIVPVRDDPRLAACLEALRAQTYPRERYEIIVVNNGRRDGWITAVECDAQWRVVHESVPGVGPARNAGVQYARGDVIAFTDADCVPDADWLSEGVRALRDHADLVAGHVDFFFASQTPTAIEYADATSFMQQQQYARRGYAATANAFMMRSIFLEAGGFDPAMRHLQDMDLGLRLSRAGRRVVYAPSARVRHPARTALSELLTKRRAQAHYHHLIRPWTWRRVVRAIAGQRPSATWRRVLTDPALGGLRTRVGYAAVVHLMRATAGWTGARLLLSRRGIGRVEPPHY